MPKSKDPFAGMKLTEQTTDSNPPVDQRLFTDSSPAQKPGPVTSPVQPVRIGGQEEKREPGSEGVLEAASPGGSEGEIEEGQTQAGVPHAEQKPYRKESFLLTDSEFEALEDLKLDLRRKHTLKTTKNDIVRAAFHHILEDYERNGATSVILRRLRRTGGK